MSGAMWAYDPYFTGFGTPWVATSGADISLSSLITTAYHMLRNRCYQMLKFSNLLELLIIKKAFAIKFNFY
jgi:hypothetical protein